MADTPERAERAITPPPAPLAQWSTGIGDTATVVARLTHDQLHHNTRRLAAELTRLSLALLHPPRHRRRSAQLP
ncbi:hypothetical protein [Nonomuraea sp. NPDC005650]|uniref:hypothetical protein n=1 Tax=Nonomuraea sp. NPDC005650 TaxID=3157045 RepID=UPI0033B1BAB2